MYLLIHHSPAWGGGTLSCFDIARMLYNNGVQFKICFPKGADELVAYAKENGFSCLIGPDVPVFRYYSGGPNRLKVLLNYFFSHKNKVEWRKFIEKNNIDGVLLNSIVLWPLLKVFYEFSIPSILFIRETQRGFKWSLFNALIRSNINKYASGVSFLSEYDQNRWELKSSVIQAVIPDVVDIKNADSFRKEVDLSYYNNNYNAEKDIAILFSGGISRLKGTLTAIKTIEMLDEHVKLFICGNIYNTNIPLMKIIIQPIDYLYAKYVIKKCNKNSLKERVTFVGVVKDMSKWYYSCHICLIPITKPHQSRSIYEAGVYEKPVVATKFRNYEEYIKDGQNGFLARVGCSVEFANAINRLKDKDLRDKMGVANREYTERYHSSDYASEILSTMLKKIFINY